MIAKGMAPAAPEVMLRVSGSFVIGDMRDRHRDMERLRETDTWRETEAEMEAEKPRHSYRREAGEETQRRSAESDEQGAGVWRRHGKMQRRGAGGGGERKGVGTTANPYGSLCLDYKRAPVLGPCHPLGWELSCRAQPAPQPGAAGAESVSESPAAGAGQAQSRH